MPPMRLSIIDYVARNPHSSTQEVRRGIDKPRSTVDRQLQALHMLGVLTCDEQEYNAIDGKSKWFYTLADDIDPDVLLVPSKLPRKVTNPPTPQRESRNEDKSLQVPSSKSGQLSDPDEACPVCELDGLPPGRAMHYDCERVAANGQSSDLFAREGTP